MNDKLKRVMAYLAARRGRSGFDQETIHSFDVGTHRECHLLTEDMEGLVSAVSAAEELVAAVKRYRAFVEEHSANGEVVPMDTAPGRGLSSALAKMEATQ